MPSEWFFLKYFQTPYLVIFTIIQFSSTAPFFPSSPDKSNMVGQLSIISSSFFCTIIFRQFAPHSHQKRILSAVVSPCLFPWWNLDSTVPENGSPDSKWRTSSQVPLVRQLVLLKRLAHHYQALSSILTPMMRDQWVDTEGKREEKASWDAKRKLRWPLGTSSPF